MKGGLGGSNWTYDAYYARSEYRIESRQQWPLADRIEDFFRQQFLGPQLSEQYATRSIRPTMPTSIAH